MGALFFDFIKSKEKDGEVHVREIIEDSADTVRLGGLGAVVTKRLQDLIPDHEVRNTNLAYIQRGGITSQFDRSLGIQFGVKAVDTLMNGDYSFMVAYKDGSFTKVPLEEVVGKGEVGETSNVAFVPITGEKVFDVDQR